MDKLVKILKNGDVAVIPTDTIYGIVALALDKKAVEKVYKLRKRNPKKPFIILISSVNDLKKFGIKLSVPVKKILNNVWPGKVSVILPCPHTRMNLVKKYPMKSDKNSFGVGVYPHKKFNYLHRGTKTLAFRLPAKKSLIKLLKQTGPLVAPSANWEGQPPAKTIKEAKRYFKDRVLYVDAGKLESLASTLIEIKNGKIKVIREGAVNLHTKRVP